MDHPSQVQVPWLQFQLKHRLVFLPGDLTITQQAVKTGQVLTVGKQGLLIIHYTFIPGRLRDAVLPPSTGKDWPVM